MHEKKLIIGISGFATSGKDTCALLISSHLKDLQVKSKIFSFASTLKKDIDDFCIQKIGISAFVNDAELKKKIRPILISYGQIQREISFGTYWIYKIKPKIEDFLNQGGDVAIISDLRFKEYDYDEYDFLRSFNKNMLLYLSRITNEGSMIPPAHASEKSSSLFLTENADHNICWRSSNDTKYLYSCLTNVFKDIKEKI